MTIPDTNYKSSNYSDSDLVKIFPVTSFYYVSITGTKDHTTSRGTVDLTTSYNTTDYAVFSSIYFPYTGDSDGTYDDNSTSSAVNTMIIYSITKASFNWVFTHGSGDNLNIYVVFMVVFNSGLDYSKSRD